MENEKKKEELFSSVLYNVVQICRQQNFKYERTSKNGRFVLSVLIIFSFSILLKLCLITFLITFSMLFFITMVLLFEAILHFPLENESFP